VPVVGYGTDRLAGFYLADSGFPVPWRADTPEEVARIQRARDELGLPQALVLANPVSAAEQMDPALHDRTLAEALAAAQAAGVSGREATPFVLGRFHERTAGESVRVNVALVLRNAALAARIAVALAG
jgi:pseudouridylate synthase